MSGGLTLQERAQWLPTMAQAVAINPAMTDFKVSNAAVAELDLEWWVFVITVAGVFVGFTSLRHSDFDARLKEELRASAQEAFEQWNPRALDAFDNCKAFYRKQFDDQITNRAPDDAHLISVDIMVCGLSGTC